MASICYKSYMKRFFNGLVLFTHTTRALWLGLLQCSGVALLGVHSTGTLADNWPTKPLRFISPYAPGGGNDLLSRLIATSLSPRIGQNVIVENKPGANTIVGTDYVVHAPADGYTYIILTNTVTINPHLYKKLAFDITKDLTPVTQIGTSALIACVHPSLPVTHIKSLIALAKSNPQRLNNGSSGNGSTGHLAGALLAMKTGILITHIPYKGVAPVITDLLGGQIEMSFSPAMSMLPLIHSSRLRAIAVTSPTRLLILPKVESIAETVKGYSAENWYALFTTANTPPDIVERMRQQINALLEEKTIKSSLFEQGLNIKTNNTQQMAKKIAAELSQWSEVIQATGIKAD